MSYFRTLLVVVFIGGVLYGVVAPTPPVTLTSPESSSMEPTVPEDSLAVVLNVEPDVGDIALFETPRQDSLVLHRLVGEPTPDTFLTKGDNNRVTDQEAGDPPIPADSIRGVVPTIAGIPLAVPLVGVFTTNPIITIGIWSLLVLIAVYRTTGLETTQALVSTQPTGLYLAGIGLILLTVLPLVILSTPISVESHLIISDAADADASYVAAIGGQTTHTITIQEPMLAALHSTAHGTSDVSVRGFTTSLGTPTAEIAVTNRIVDTRAVFRETLTVYTYPPTLPRAWVAALAGVAPALAAVATSAVLAVPAFIGAIIFAQPQPARSPQQYIYQARRARRHHRQDTNE